MIRLGKQQVSDSPESWKKEVAGILGFIRKMKATKMGEFDYWRKGMIAHYTARMKFLRAHKPKGVK